MSKTRAKKSFVVCLSNDGYAASLEPRKIYVALRDAAAERNGLLRVVDELGNLQLTALHRSTPHLRRIRRSVRSLTQGTTRCRSGQGQPIGIG